MRCIPRSSDFLIWEVDSKCQFSDDNNNNIIIVIIAKRYSSFTVYQQSYCLAALLL